MLFSRNGSCVFFFQGCDHPKTCGYTKPPRRAQQKSWLVRGITQGHIWWSQGGHGVAPSPRFQAVKPIGCGYMIPSIPMPCEIASVFFLFFFGDRYGGSSARARPSNPATQQPRWILDDLRILVPCLHLLIILLTLMLWLLWPVLWLVPGRAEGDAGLSRLWEPTGTSSFRFCKISCTE